MSLPSGYKRLEYIKSSGTQYINTGFKPNQNTKVIADFECVSGNSDPTVFGAWNGQISNAFLFLALASRDSGMSFWGTQFSSYTKDMTARHVVTADKTNWSIDGASISGFSSATFSCTVPMFIFAYNNNGSVGNLDSSIKIYSCQIYDNGTLIRDYIPCQTTAGEVGLWDDVNSVFYGNAGTGTFTAGPAVASPSIFVNIDGIWKPINHIYVNINNIWQKST